MICNNCRYEMVYVAETEKVVFENEEYPYLYEYYQCPKCGNVYSLMNYENEVHSVVNRKIRDEHGMLQPDEITRRRIACGVGLREFWYTYLRDVYPLWTRYSYVELGTLQTKEEDNAIRKALDAIEKENAGKRRFPLWLFGWDYRNDLEPERLFWTVEMLCLNKPISWDELNKKLLYFDCIQGNYTGAKYSLINGNYCLDFGEVVLDYMVNVQKTLSVETVDGIEYYKSEKVTEYEVLSNDGISGHYEQRCQNRIILLEKLRTTDGIELILESEDERRFYRSEAHRFNFRTICL